LPISQGLVEIQSAISVWQWAMACQAQHKSKEESKGIMSLRANRVALMKISSRIVVMLATVGLVWTALQAGTGPGPDGKKIFNARCSICHGADGSGNTSSGKKVKAKDLRSAKVQELSDDELLETIRFGLGPMPGFEKKLKPDQMQQVLVYVRELGQKTESKLKAR
jgi:mono/diheme cytochrome c family protein